MSFITIFIAAIIIMGLALAGLAISILVKKGGRFPNTHIHGNKYLNEQGIHCIQTYDNQEQIKANKKVDYKDLTLDKNGYIKSS